MRARIERDALARMVRACTPAIGHRAYQPVLNGLRFDATDGRLTVTGSDLSLTIAAVADADVTTTGAAIVPGKTIDRVVSALPSGAVSLDLGDDHLSIVCADTEAKVNTVNDDWPHLPAVDMHDAVTLTAQQAADIARILPMASGDDNRPALTGVRFDSGQARTTDSYRGAIAELGPGLPDCTPPAEAVRTVFKTAGDAPVAMAATDRHVAFQAGDVTWTVAAIEEAHPPFGQLIRDASPQLLAVDADQFVSSVKRVGAIAGEEGTVTRLTVEGDKLTVWRTSSGHGSIRDVIPCDSNLTSTVGFNPVYLVDMVEAARSDRVTLELDGPLKPVVLRTDRLVQLLMPVRIP